jgi:hypothetical protein
MTALAVDKTFREYSRHESGKSRNSFRSLKCLISRSAVAFFPKADVKFRKQ